jgi:uncharacterized protein
MAKLLSRAQDIVELKRRLKSFPVTALLGPRQCGKTTIARESFPTPNFFDLENPRDLARLENPQLVLENLKGLIIIDEIQRLPNIFPLMRYLVDQKKKQKFLILGSASRELLRQTSETLAGRIAYYELDGFDISDVGSEAFRKLWLRGGFPRSFLPTKPADSLLWRTNYITTYLEHDIPQLGIQIPAQTLRRFWTMLAHYHGQVVNYSEIGRNFGISDKTVRHYLDILQGTFMIRLLQPWYVNVGKRLVKSPKLYFRDSGILHSLLSLTTQKEVESHPRLGASWEGFVIEAVCRQLSRSEIMPYFWSTHSGAEVDLFWQSRGKNFVVEAKYGDAPRFTESMRSALKDLDLARLWVIYPGSQKYELHEKVTVVPMKEFDSLRVQFR